MKHEIKTEDLVEWSKTAKILYAAGSSKDGQKRLFVDANGIYIIEVGGLEEPIQTGSAEAAVNIYNSI